MGIAVYSIMLVAWSITSPGETVYKIGTSLPFKAVLFFYVINNLLCLIRQFPLSFKACRPETGKTEDRLRQGRHYLSDVPVSAAEEAFRGLRKRLFRLGYRVFANEDGFTAVKGRFTPLASLVFHVALFTLVLGIIGGILFGSSGDMVLAEGQTFTGQKAEYASFEPEERFDSSPKPAFKVTKIRPEFWKDVLLFTDLYADLVFPPEKPTGSKRVRLNVPWKPAAASYLRITGLGYAPLYHLTGPDNELLEQGFVNLVSFPPGTEDNFTTGVGGYTVKISVFPDHRRSGSKLSTKSLDLENPAFLVTVRSGGRTVFEGTVLPRRKVTLEQGLELSFPEVRYWGHFFLVNNPGLPFLWLGFLIGSIAVAWRLFFYQRQINVLLCQDNRIIVAGRFDYYQWINEDWLKKIVERAFGTGFTKG